MFGIFYLILCVLTGMEMAGCLFPQQITEKGNRIWVILPAAFGTGVLMLTWAVYVVSWMFSVCAGAEHPLFYGNIIVMSVTVLCLLGIFIRSIGSAHAKRRKAFGNGYVGVGAAASVDHRLNAQMAQAHVCSFYQRSMHVLGSSRYAADELFIPGDRILAPFCGLLLAGLFNGVEDIGP